MESTLRWLNAHHQTTSSFISNSLHNDGSDLYGNGAFSHGISTILDAPLPRSLQLDTTPLRASAHHKQQSITPHEAKGGRSVNKSIDAFAVGSPHAGTVFDALLQKGKEYQMRREALQEKALKEESKLMRSSPTVSSVAKAMQVRTEPIENRLLRKAHESEQRNQFAAESRNLQNQKLMQTVAPFKPNISAKGKQAESKVMTADYQENWHRRREQRIEARKTENLIKEIEDLREGPDINSRSQRLAAQKKEKEGLAGLSHVEAMLERDRLAKLAAWEKSQRELEQISNPQITVFAAALQREGSAGDRLYAASFEAEERRLQRMRETIDSDLRRSFSPRISRLAATTGQRGGLPVEERLSMRHQEAMIQREESVKLEVERERTIHQPSINPVSDAIASRLPLSAKERLVQPRRRHVDPSSDADGHQSPSVSRGSNISRSSSVSSALSSTVVDRLEAMATYEERREEHIQRLKQEKAEREMEECTFAPNTNRNSTAKTSVSQQSVIERNSQWNQKRQMKIEEQRRLNSEQELGKCTFAPAVPKAGLTPTAQPQATPEETIYGGDGTPWGVSEFVQRMEEARKLKNEKEVRQVTQTEKWKPSITVPKEFQLGRVKTPVKSLQRPLLNVPIDDTPETNNNNTNGPSRDVNTSPPPPVPFGSFMYRAEKSQSNSADHRPPLFAGAPIVPPSLWNTTTQF